MIRIFCFLDKFWWHVVAVEFETSQGIGPDVIIAWSDHGLFTEETAALALVDVLADEIIDNGMC